MKHIKTFRVVNEGKLNERVSDKEVFAYLNDLRDSGKTNMFGAAAYIEKDFGLDKRKAKEILVKWMKSFNEGKLNELDANKSKEYVKKATDEFHDALFAFEHSYPLKLIAKKDRKLENMFNALVKDFSILRNYVKQASISEAKLNEAKSYDLDLENTWDYDKVIGDAVRKLEGIDKYDKMAREGGKTAADSTAYSVTIEQYGKADNTDALKKILKKADSNLDVNKIKNNFDATDNERSGHDKSNDIWKYDIPKKIDYHKAKKMGILKETPITKMDHEVVMSLMDMMAAYTSKATPLADTAWTSLDSFMSAASDYITGSDWKRFEKSVKKEFPKLK